MYSMVLVAALASSPMTPDCHFGRGCHGCHGCYGSCYGGCCGGGYGCSGYGCSGSYGCTGGTMTPTAPPPPAKKEMPGEAVPPPKEKASLDRARLIVSLPADARLFIDDQATTSTSAQRTFVSPPLDADKTFVYTVRAEVVRDGQTISDIKTVNVTPGRVSQVSFMDLGTEANGGIAVAAGR